MEEFRSPISVQQCYNCQFSDIRPKIVGENKNVSSVERIIQIKDAGIKKQENPNVLIVRGHMLHLTKGVRNTEKQAFRQHVVNKQKRYASIGNQNTLAQPKTEIDRVTLTAEQLTKFVANVVIKIAQPQVCYPNPKQDTLDLKSSMCRKVSNATKTIPDVDLFESIGPLSVPAPPPPPPLHHSSSRAPNQPSLQNHLESIHSTKIHYSTWQVHPSCPQAAWNLQVDFPIIGHRRLSSAMTGVLWSFSWIPTFCFRIAKV